MQPFSPSQSHKWYNTNVGHCYQQSRRVQPVMEVSTMIVPQKTCVACGQTKPLSMFHKNRTGRDGHRVLCARCAIDLSFDARRRKKWKKLYGITPERYYEMLQRQSGVCAICGEPETGKARNGGIRLLAVDHSHKTGQVRGLLCGRCNIYVGYLENTDKVRAVIEYLKIHDKE